MGDVRMRSRAHIYMYFTYLQECKYSLYTMLGNVGVEISSGTIQKFYGFLLQEGSMNCPMRVENSLGDPYARQVE